jgi:hypothetical protein
MNNKQALCGNLERFLSAIDRFWLLDLVIASFRQEARGSTTQNELVGMIQGPEFILFHHPANKSQPFIS